MKNTLMIVLFGTAILASGCSTPHKSDSSTKIDTADTSTTLPKSDSPDSGALQGTWRGPEIGGRTPGECSLRISGHALEFRGVDANDWCKGTFTLRDSNPRQLIGTITECPDSDYVGRTVHSIYRIEAGTLILTGNPPGDPEVPPGFDAPGSRNFRLKKL
jgi:hypothetical protein